MWKTFNFVTKYFTKRRQRYITKTIAMNQQEFQLREITYQDIKDLLAIEREVYAGNFLGRCLLSWQNLAQKRRISIC